MSVCHLEQLAMTTKLCGGRLALVLRARVIGSPRMTLAPDPTPRISMMPHDQYRQLESFNHYLLTI